MDPGRTPDHDLDSIDQLTNQPTLGKLLLSGYTIKNTADRKFLTFDPLLKSVTYNTVEGFAFKLGANYTKVLEDGKSYQLQPEFRYGFSNKIFTANLKAKYDYDPQHLANVGFSFGSGIYDLNNLGSMPVLYNSLNSLLFERNFSKFYKKNFIQLNTARELANGLQAEVIVNYAKNRELVNTSDFSIFDWKDRSFTSNHPYAPDTDDLLFGDYSSLTLTVGLTYTIGQKYISLPNGKFYQASRSPTFKLTYRKGIKELLSSDADYDLLSLEISKEKINTGIAGYSSFYIGVGKFLNNNALYYPDRQHFRGNNSLASPPDIRKFSYLDFYRYSTNQQYFELHAEHHLAGLLLNKVAILRQFKLEELFGFNYLKQPSEKNYTELYVGIQRLIFRATYGFSFEGSNHVEHGFRIFYGF